MKTRIVHICPYFYPKIGGVEKYVYQLAREQVRMGMDVTVICRNEGTKDITETIDGIKVHRVGCRQTRGIRVVESMGEIVKKLKATDAEIFHAHDWTQSLACVSAGKEFVTTVHGYGGTLERVPFFPNFIRQIVGKSKRIAVNHKFLLDKYKKATYIHAGISLQEYPFKKITNKETILIVSRLSPERHVDIAIKGFMLLKDDKLNLLIAGDGPKKERLMALCKGKKNIKFLGFRTDIPKLISEAAMVYGGPLTVIEALAIGRPGIIVQEKDTELISSSQYLIDTPREFAIKVRYFLKHLDEESKIARKIAEEEFDIKQVAVKYNKFYEGIK